MTEDDAATIARLREENDRLRGLLAKGQGPCVYCNLPAEDIAKCQSGFPGCARMDDIINAANTDVNRLEQRLHELLQRGAPTPETVLEYRKAKHHWVQVPTWIETDRTDDPCFLCINSKDDPIHNVNQTDQCSLR